MSARRFEGRLGEALEPLAARLGWRLRSFDRGGEQVAVAPLDDERFEQVIWALDEARRAARVLLVLRAGVPPEREPAILELCARINDGLPFGCAEFSFAERSVVFRDALDARDGVSAAALERITATVLSLGARYGQAIERTLAGLPAERAVREIEAAAPPDP